MIDLLIKNATLVDGTGAPGQTGDLAIRGDHIIAAGTVDSGIEAREVIDGTGLVCCPGFIDVHSHSDHNLLVGPEAESKILQGVTTEIVGNCGYSGAPLSDLNIAQRRAGLACYGLDPQWRDFAGFLDALDAAKPALNVVTMVGHGTLRSAVTGHDKRAATETEQSRMEAILDEAIDAGAYGFSTGLAYAPGIFAGEDELTSLSRVAAKRDAICTSHMRSESDKLIEALDEFLRIGRAANARLQVSHLKAAGRANWGRTTEAIARIEQYQKDGLDIAFDRYPYTAASSSLDIFLPDWAQDGGNDRMIERAKSAEHGRALRDAMADSVERHCGWDNVRITFMELSAPHEAEGKSIGDYAREVGGDPADVAIELLIESRGRAGIVFFSMCEEDVREVLAHPWCMIGSDASVRCTHGPLAQGVPHPRAYGTFPRYLGEYVREHKLIDLEEAIRRLTSFSADHFRMARRGRLAPGYYADVVLFNPATIRDMATYDQPHQNAAGISAVIVNGRVVAREGGLTGERTGRVLRFGEG